MPATTRSSNKQAKLEDVGAVDVESKGTKRKAGATKASPSKKRRADAAKDGKDTDVKKPERSQGGGKGSGRNGDNSVVINRAPVLELWTSCVTQFLHPSVSWETCLSAGGAVATITAISKGRSIGKVDKPDPGEAEEKRQKRKEKAEKEDLEELEVMSFNLNLSKDGQAMVGGKPKKAGEEALRKKYGGAEQYEKVKMVFQEALKSWKGREEELNGRAFGFYEDFRPSVSPGQQGWGRKGEIRFETIKDVVGGT